jgi:hypothetical protein
MCACLFHPVLCAQLPQPVDTSTYGQCSGYANQHSHHPQGNVFQNHRVDAIDHLVLREYWQKRLAYSQRASTLPALFGLTALHSP